MPTINLNANSEIKRRDRLLTSPLIGRGGWFFRGFLFFLGAFLVTLVLVYGQSQGVGDRQYVIGEPSPHTLFAPFEITYDDEIATEVLRQKKIQSVPAVYSVEAEAVDRTLSHIETFFQQIQDARQAPAGGQSQTTEWVLRLPASTIKFLIETGDLQDIRDALQVLLEQIVMRGILADEAADSFRETETGLITVLFADQSEEVVEASGVFMIKEVQRTAGDFLPESMAKERNLKKAVLDIFGAVLAPNLSLDQTQTEVRQIKAAESVQSSEDTIQKDELIIQRGRLVTPKEKQRIDAVQAKLAARKVLNELIATGVLILLTYFLAFQYLLRFERKVLVSLRRVFLIHSVLLLSVVICKAVMLWPASSSYLMPTAIASLLVVLLMGARIGVLAACMMTVITAPMVNFQIDAVLATLISSLTATFAALRVRKRVQFLKVGLAIGISYALVLFAFQFFEGGSLFESLQISIPGIANGLLITIPLCFLVLPLFESLFELNTDITLLELSDLNHPLLKKMVVQAPGTYHHSLVVSALAESACESIGANALLARVGCYFHDIGKIAKADYFTENVGQKGPSRHDRLTPKMSFITILNHVKGGLDLGRQFKLKEPILRFIPEHHGTSVVWYFYKKAVDEAQAGDVVQADDYRYPGPKPQSRETAVSMLADSTEAASRSLLDPTPERIRQLVRKIINDKFIDGQLDECDLTLRDLHRIQESFAQNLLAIYHTRISYPAKPEHPDNLDLFEPAKGKKIGLDPRKKKS